MTDKDTLIELRNKYSNKVSENLKSENFKKVIPHLAGIIQGLDLAISHLYKLENIT